MNEYLELVCNLLEYRPNFEKNYPNTVGVINFRNTLYNAGLLPAKRHPDYQPAYLRDSKSKTPRLKKNEVFAGVKKLKYPSFVLLERFLE